MLSTPPVPRLPRARPPCVLNALTYGLRAASLLIPGEDPEAYRQLWAELVEEWQPQTRTERLQLEQMATSQWLLARVSQGESNVYAGNLPAKDQFALLGQASTQRVRLERSFSNALRELKQLQKERQSRSRQQPLPVTGVQSPVHQPAGPAVPLPAYLMSAPTDDRSMLCADATPDTR